MLVTGETFEEAREKASMMAERILDKIRELKLQVAIEKTEVVAFYKQRYRPPKEPSIQIGRISIPIKTSFKYLGIIIDSKLTFNEHFQYIERKITKVTRALCRILPNLRGPHETKRRLYANIIQSIVMYGAPVWSDKLEKSKTSQRLLTKVQRTVAIKIIAGYRTISYDAATALARTPPWTLVAEKYNRIYIREQEAKNNDTWTTDIAKRIKREEDDAMMDKWKLILEKTSSRQ